jgi:hypothetical protein
VAQALACVFSVETFEHIMRYDRELEEKTEQIRQNPAKAVSSVIRIAMIAD